MTAGGSSWHDIAYINYQDTKAGDITIQIQDVNLTAVDYIKMKLANSVTSNDDIYMVWGTDGTDIVKLGSSADDAEADELQWGSTPTNIGTKDNDLRTAYGVVIKDPEANGADDKVVLEMPADQVKAKVVVYGPEGSKTTTGGETIKKVVPITTPVAKLDTEIPDPSTVDKNLVLVGGPAVNRLTAQALGLDYPTYGADSGIPENAAMIKVIEGAFKEGKVAVIVAGWEAENTRVACSVLQQYESFKDALEGNTAVKITGTTVETATIEPLE